MVRCQINLKVDDHRFFCFSLSLNSFPRRFVQKLISSLLFVLFSDHFVRLKTKKQNLKIDTIMGVYCHKETNQNMKQNIEGYTYILMDCIFDICYYFTKSILLVWSLSEVSKFNFTLSLKYYKEGFC